MFLIPGDTLGPKFWTPWAHKCYTRSNSKLDYLGHSGPRLLGIPCYRVSSDFCDRGEELLILGSLCMRTLLLFLHTLYTDSMADPGELVLLGLNQCTDRKNTNSQISDQRRALLLVLLGP